jgi:predicted GH43/DUF377 family glycosyl hydrolase
MSKILWLFFFFPILGNPKPIDLEQTAQNFVLEAKKIEIPGYPHAFNPSIIRWQGKLLLSFRIIPDPKQSFNAEIGLVWLDEHFHPISTPQLLNLRDEYSIAPNRAEDARLITIDQRLYMIYDDNMEPKISKGGFRVYVAQIFYDGEHFIPDQVECLSYFEGASRNRREKAWVPFDYHGNLLLAYSLIPHLIFYPRLDGTGMCDTVARSHSHIFWQWGELRGGTPAHLIDGQYLSFFHSSIDMQTIHSDNKNISHYFMGAYTFSPEPPFTLTAISPEPIIGKGFYSGTKYKPYWKPICCVFPCGYVYDEHFFWVAYGRDDHETWIVKLDRKKLLESLIPVNQIK